MVPVGERALDVDAVGRLGDPAEEVVGGVAGVLGALVAVEGVHKRPQAVLAAGGGCENRAAVGVLAEERAQVQLEPNAACAHVPIDDGRQHVAGIAAQ